MKLGRKHWTNSVGFKRWGSLQAFSCLRPKLPVSSGRSRATTLCNILKMLLWVLICICMHIFARTCMHIKLAFSLFICIICLYNVVITHFTKQNFNKKLTFTMQFTDTYSFMIALQWISKPFWWISRVHTKTTAWGWLHSPITLFY